MIKVLFLAADPSATKRLQISEELREIESRIRVAEHRDLVEIVPAWALRPSDLQQALLRHQPHVVHFAAHGSPTTAISLENDEGNVVPLSSAAIGTVFRILKDHIRVVILEQCYSKAQANALANSVGCVLAIPKGLSGVGSIAFCIDFYRALAYGRSLRESFDLAVNGLMLLGFKGETPQLVLSANFDPQFRFQIELKAPPHVSVSGERSVAIGGDTAGSIIITGSGINEIHLGQTSFANLGFGAPSAERDLNKGLTEYFVESKAFRRIYSGGRFIVLGNRGVGKSAIFRIISERERGAGTIVIELRPEDFSYELLNAVLPPGRDGQWAKHGAYTAAWKYLIYVLVMKDLAKNGATYKRGPAGRIHSYLRNNHKGLQGGPIDLLLSYLHRMEGVKLGPYEASIKSKELTKLYKLEEINRLLPDIIEVCKNQKVLVLVDELDRGWDASQDAKAFVAGLFQAVISINQLSEDLRVLLSLRMELYETIPSLYDDVQKYRDVMEIISWEEPSLLQLVAQRIRHTVPALALKTDVECWNTVFVETLDYRNTKSYNYFFDRTLYRPREIIQFCTDALEQARETQTWPIDYSVISKAEAKYSKGRTEDIVSEYQYQYPGLRAIFEWFRGRSFNLTETELIALYEAVSDGKYYVSDAANWIKEQRSDELIETLWKIGFLRAQAGESANGRPGSGSYLGPHQVSNLNLRNISRFQVHPMFRSFLGMKESRGRRSPDHEGKSKPRSRSK